MQFGNLSKVTLSHLTQTFNQAFSDYVIPMQIPAPQLAEILIRDGTNLQFSPGAFADNQLAGFILQAIGEWRNILTAYNGGTGVVPDFRGNKITRRLYEYVIPTLQAEGVAQCQLEVLTNNPVALNTYRAIGFTENRHLISFLKPIRPFELARVPKVAGIQFREVSWLDWEKVVQWWEAHPTWQYSVAAMQRLGDRVLLLGAFEGSNLVGYATMIRSTNRLTQIAVAPGYRGRGIGRQLIRQLALQATGPVTLINLEDTATDMQGFLEDQGFSRTITQFEMILPLK